MFFVSHSMFSVTHNMSKRKTVPVHQLLGFSHGLIFFWVLGLSHPWLYDADNRVTNKIGKGYCACFQCETTKGSEEGTGNRARGPQLLFFFGSVSQN